MKFHFRIIFLIVTAIVSSASDYCSAREFRAISVADGLSDLVVNDIYKDPSGYIWLGTGTAVDRFDGSRIRSYWIPGENAMLKRVNAIARTSDGTIVAGNGTGLYALRPDDDKLRPFLSDKINFAVNALASGGTNLYVGTQKGLFIINDSTKATEHIMPHSDIMSKSNTISDLTTDPAGGVWMSSADGIIYYKDKTLRHYPWDAGNGIPNKIALVGNKVVVSTTDNHIMALNAEDRGYDTILEPDNKLISSLASDGSDLLYIGTDGEGVLVYSMKNGKIVEHLQHDSRLIKKNGLRSNSVYSLHTDSDGLLWVGYYQAGVDFTPARRDLFDVYGYDAFDSEEKTIRALAIDGPEKLIGTREGLYYINESTGRSAYFGVPQIRANMIFSITPDEGLYYIGTFNGGMYVFDPATLELSDFDPKNKTLLSGAIFAVTSDDKGNLWIGTSDGLFRYTDGKQTAHFTDTNSRLPHGNVYEIFFDSSGRGWICTESGMCVWDGQSLHEDGFPKGFPNKEKIRDIYETSDHTLYFVPDKGRIFTSNIPLTEFGYPGIFGENENSTSTFVIQDPHERIWIGLNGGLVCYDKDGGVRMFNDVDGLPGTIFTLCPPVIDEKGDIWFGSSGGLVHLDYKSLDSETGVIDKASISEVIVNGKQLHAERSDKNPNIQQVTIRGGKTPVTFHFADLSFIEPEYQIYEYQLEGIDDGWQFLSGKSEVTYFDIPNGNYRMKVRRAGSGSTESEIDIIVRNTINWHMVLLIALLAMSASAALYYYVQHRKNSRQKKPYTASETTATGTEKYRTTRLSEKECRALYKKLEDTMRQKKPYIRSDLKIGDLAEELGTSAHAMSFLFNQYLKKKYYDYINEYRVAEFKRMVEDGSVDRYTLTAMSEKCGFSSRASFFRHFKNHTGITPNEYIKLHQK